MKGIRKVKVYRSNPAVEFVLLGVGSYREKKESSLDASPPMAAAPRKRELRGAWQLEHFVECLGGCTCLGPPVETRQCKLVRLLFFPVLSILVREASQPKKGRERALLGDLDVGLVCQHALTKKQPLHNFCQTRRCE